MPREVEALDAAVDGVGLPAAVLLAQVHEPACGGGLDVARGRFGVAVAHEEDTVVHARKHLRGERVRDGVLAHHAAGDEVDVARGGHERRLALLRQTVRLDVVAQAVAGLAARRVVRRLVVDHRHLRAEAAEVHGHVGDEPLLLEAPDFTQQLLALAEREHGDEHGTIVRQHLADAVREAAQLALARVGGVALGAAVRAFHDEHVHPLLREVGARNHRLVVELHVSRVENRRARGGFELHAAGAEDVPRVVQGGEHLAVAPRAEGLAVGAHHPGARHVVERAVQKEGVLGDALFHALARHHVHRVVQHGDAHLRRAAGHHDLRLRVFLLEHGQRADVVEVRVGDEDAVGRRRADELVGGLRRVAVALGVHACIEHDARAVEVEHVAVGADFRLPGEVGEGNHDERSRRSMPQAAANVNARLRLRRSRAASPVAGCASCQSGALSSTCPLACSRSSATALPPPTVGMMCSSYLARVQPT